jgi:exonuclease SbcC
MPASGNRPGSTVRFASEADFVAACLSAEQRAALQSLQQQLDKAVQQAEALLQAAQSQRQAWRHAAQPADGRRAGSTTGCAGCRAPATERQAVPGRPCWMEMQPAGPAWHLLAQIDRQQDSELVAAAGWPDRLGQGRQVPPLCPGPDAGSSGVSGQPSAGPPAGRYQLRARPRASWNWKSSIAGRPMSAATPVPCRVAKVFWSAWRAGAV